jgi:cytochrome b involved in lipid metabolism
MRASDAPGPAARVLAEATSRNAALEHENAGPLSESHGFLAQRAPRHDLPPPYDAWVAAVDELPELCSSLRLRARLDGLPLLDASPDALDDRHLLRAASVLGLLAHAYGNVPMRPVERLPEQLVRPWLQTAERLERPPYTLSNSDFIFDNWRVVDPAVPEPMRVENLRLLNAVWDHPQMDTFILVLVELLARSAPLVGAAARAQAACLAGNDEGVAAELALMIETVRRLTERSLPKISANARAGSRRVDPVLWTKLFAMLPLPVPGADDDVRNASGAETPYFHLLDVVLGRRLYETQLGHEAMQFRRTHPPHWREFIAAVGQESIASYVRERDDRELSTLFAELGDAYHGRDGLLARHRLKAFAYMEAAFKTGRSSTVTGFTGLFEDRAWETVDASFEAARLERVRSMTTRNGDEASAPPRRFSLPSDPSVPILRLADEPGIERPTAARVRDLIATGGSIHVCGTAPFVRRAMESAADALGSEALYDLIVQRRYVQEVLPAETARGPEIDASELVLHSEPEDGIWMAIDGKVYDLTAFAEIHPGGQKLIHSFAGMDATRSYRIVEHHLDPSIDALLSVFEIGSMRRLRLEHAPVEALFRHWLRTLYVLVEIENAHRLDASIRGEPLRRGERAGTVELTPYRLQFALEAHRRFFHQTLEIVCRRVGGLWQATSKPGASDPELDDLPAGPDAVAARESCDELERRLESEGATADLDALLTERQAAERAYLREVKSLVASGLRAFELHEADALTHGREVMLAALRGIAPLTRGHLADASRLARAR